MKYCIIKKSLRIENRIQYKTIRRIMQLKIYLKESHYISLDCCCCYVGVMLLCCYLLCRRLFLMIVRNDSLTVTNTRIASIIICKTIEAAATDMKYFVRSKFSSSLVHKKNFALI